MKFDFNYEKCSDLGLIVNHGNKDNVVLFFDEVEEAACYRACLFRTNANYGEGFIEKADITRKQIVITDQDNTQKRIVEERINNNAGRPLFIDKNLVIDSVATYRNARIHVAVKYPFKEVKFITSLESSRNDLYINIDFLPCGSYFVILQVEDRNGNIIKEAKPYYFKVDRASNDDIIKAIEGAGHVAASSGKPIVYN